jgi:hypothetical protein
VLTLVGQATNENESWSGDQRERNDAHEQKLLTSLADGTTKKSRSFFSPLCVMIGSNCWTVMSQS